MVSLRAIVSVNHLKPSSTDHSFTPWWEYFGEDANNPSIRLSVASSKGVRCVATSDTTFHYGVTFGPICVTCGRTLAQILVIFFWLDGKGRTSFSDQISNAIPHSGL